MRESLACAEETKALKSATKPDPAIRSVFLDVKSTEMSVYKFLTFRMFQLLRTVTFTVVIALTTSR